MTYLSHYSHKVSKKTLITFGFIVGLIIRVCFLFYMGTHDMETNKMWGDSILHNGLARAYHGNYFPLQWQIFGLCALTTEMSGLPFYIIYKIPNLLFDIGTFFVLLNILKQNRIDTLHVLTYWLHPWFLCLFYFGYVDFQFTFLVITSIRIIQTNDRVKTYLLSGLPLGLAFMMKPQMLAVIAALMMYTVVDFTINKKYNCLWLLISPAIIFAGYTLYFTYDANAHFNWYSFTFLAKTYLNVGEFSPILTGHMLNIWYPVAYFFREPGSEIYTVLNNIKIFHILTIKSLATSVTLLIMFSFVCMTIKSKCNYIFSYNIFYVLLFTSIIVPFINTSAHENHLFLCSVLMIIFLARKNCIFLSTLFWSLMLLNAINVYCLYGTDRSNYSVDLRFFISIFSIISLTAICFSIISTVKNVSVDVVDIVD